MPIGIHLERFPADCQQNTNNKVKTQVTK